MGHSMRPNEFRSGSNARTKGEALQLIKMSVRRLLMKESIRKTGHSSTLAGPGCPYLEIVSLSVVERIGWLRE